MGPRVAQELQAIFLWARQCALVWKDHFVRIILEPAEANKSLAGANLRGPRHGESLEIGEECRFRYLLQDPACAPLFQICCCPRIDVVRG